jgi:hypothetical protein
MLIHTMTGPGTKAKGLTLLLVHECTPIGYSYFVTSFVSAQEKISNDWRL